MPFAKYKTYSVDGGAPKRYTKENLTADSDLAAYELTDTPAAATSSDSTLTVVNQDPSNSTVDIVGTFNPPDRTEQALVEVRQDSGSWEFACHVSDEGAIVATVPDAMNKYRVITINFLGQSQGDEISFP